MIYAAGILILSVHKGKIYVLLGKDHYGTYSDFGGKSEHIDKNNPIFTASREMYEETCGSLYSMYELIDKLSNGHVIKSLSYTNKQYFMYVLFVPYDESCTERFATISYYIQNFPNYGKFKEKIDLKWFELN